MGMASSPLTDQIAVRPEDRRLWAPMAPNNCQRVKSRWNRPGRPTGIRPQFARLARSGMLRLVTVYPGHQRVGNRIAKMRDIRLLANPDRTAMTIQQRAKISR